MIFLDFVLANILEDIGENVIYRGVKNLLRFFKGCKLCLFSGALFRFSTLGVSI